uniref:Uncharacterized protein n=1 Tax=Candidatus Kentrum sp. TC TaxID=2126339 RepID=A0A451A4R4_9GAMM|nr:MAG: hypothetical protein BECKTC1821F_GA0114240_105221 [Candidatus Kentron sp. TC]
MQGCRYLFVILVGNAENRRPGIANETRQFGIVSISKSSSLKPPLAHTSVPPTVSPSTRNVG